MTPKHSPGAPPRPHLVHEDVERLLQSDSVPAAHGEEAETHAHVEPLADPAAPGQSLRLLGAPRSATCTAQGSDYHDDDGEGGRCSEAAAFRTFDGRSPCWGICSASSQSSLTLDRRTQTQRQQ